MQKKLRKYYNDEEIELIRQELMKEEGYQRKLKQGETMNKEYTYINGECIVEDEYGRKKLVEYTDKTDEILIQENVIEKPLLVKQALLD